MYAPRKFLGGEIDARYAKRQARNEPLTEIIQTKGSSDTHPAFSPNDEFANFEMFPNMINIGQTSQIKYGYVRQGLVEGMIIEEKLGSNPYKMGIVSGSDSHSSYSNNEEFNFHGSHAKADDTPQKRLSPIPNPSGDVGAVVGRVAFEIDVFAFVILGQTHHFVDVGLRAAGEVVEDRI